MYFLGIFASMRIAFVGKGGSGKSTITSLFAKFAMSTEKPVSVFDADINMHIPHLLGVTVATNSYLSYSKNSTDIKRFLIGNNTRIESLGAFRKSTPPTLQSNFFIPGKPENHIQKTYGTKLNSKDTLYVVGTYEKEDIGTTCYHGSLAILENILSHTLDSDSIIIADMVAGTDAFSNTLHTQFDIIAVLVEPTSQSIQVTKKYLELSQSAGIHTSIRLIANKIESEEEINFIEECLQTKVFTYFTKSQSIKKADLLQKQLNIEDLEDQNKKAVSDIYTELMSQSESLDDRYKKIVEIHKKYIQKDFITERHGDLSHQIDTEFSFSKIPSQTQ